MSSESTATAPRTATIAAQREPGQWILVLDFGSQFTQLIARRIRELRVYCEIHPFDLDPELIREWRPRASCSSGGPRASTRRARRTARPSCFDRSEPMLGICYGMQLAGAASRAGRSGSGQAREYGRAPLVVENPEAPFAGFEPGEEISVWMSHGDLDRLRAASTTCAYAVSTDAPIAAFGNPGARRFGVQFHPEVAHTAARRGDARELRVRRLRLPPTWTMASFIDGRWRRSGSAWATGARCAPCRAASIPRSRRRSSIGRMGDRLTCIFVDTGAAAEG